jgi:Zn-dependent peptidase ImmA (M78 family)
MNIGLIFWIVFILLVWIPVLIEMLDPIFINFYIISGEEFRKFTLPKEKIDIENKLLDNLFNICKKNNIIIHRPFYMKRNKNGGVPFGYFEGYNKKMDIWILKNIKIPYVLLHEVGHILSNTENKDSTEKGADKEANLLAKKILNENELKIIGLPYDDLSEKIKLEYELI